MLVRTLTRDFMIIAWIYEVHCGISVPMGGGKMATGAPSNTRIRFRNTSDYKREHVMDEVLMQYIKRDETTELPQYTERILTSGST